MNFQIQSFEEYQEVYKKSVDDPEAFWSSIAQNFVWKKKWNRVLEWSFTEPNVKWFDGAQLNITENCLDRHLEEHAEEMAIVWEPNDPAHEVKRFTYRELHREVCRMANVYKKLGVKKGDRICSYMPMIPELTIGVLACARIGAIHSVVFGGFSALSLRERINDSQCLLVVTSDEIRRGEKNIPAKTTVDEAIKNCPSVKNVLVCKCTGSDVPMIKNRDAWLDDMLIGISEFCEAEVMESEDMLFILYTSGSTGKPKGVVHTCGGYMVYTGYSFANVFQLSPLLGKRVGGEVFWCTADIGWITGHSYSIYGPLLNGSTMVMFEGTPTYPDPGRFWQVIDKHKVTHFYTAPTAIRALMACDPLHVVDAKLDSLKVIGTVGEPINEEAWHWYHEKIGRKNCPIVDAWWQTETGGIMISGLGNLSPMRPAHAGLPLPGIQPALLDEKGNEILENEREGFLVMKFPWPGIIRTTYSDHERCRLNYFSHYHGYYFTGDAARRDENGLYRIIGRVDDVVNVSGHRIGTAEVENALNEHPLIVESAVVGFTHDIKGQGIYAFVICLQKPTDEKIFRDEVLEVVSKYIGKFAKPDKIQVVNGLPKTRSGKIMRRILRKIAEGDTRNLGDTSTLLDPGVVEEIIKGAA
ncbi:MAG: acetate--CoA ligase [Flavobacteriales bacterium]|nr:acetate--CoA ligase [Flavobacteriales bacterium]